MVFRQVCLHSCGALLLACSLTTASQGQTAKRTQQKPALSTSELAALVKKSLVVVLTLDSKGDTVVQGSGFFVAPSLVVTNLHVLKRASEASIKSLSDGVTYKVDGVPAFALNHDLCVLFVPSASGVPLATAPDEATVGDEILVAGNPEGLEASFSKGIISAVRKESGLVQIDAPISPGSSGGPVVNRRGEVVGVAVSSLVEGQNLNFAVPISLVHNGMLTDHGQTVWAMGRLSVTNLENEGFKGPVRHFEERHAEYSRSAAGGVDIEGPTVLFTGKSFSREGRMEEIDFYLNGLGNGKEIREYSDAGLIKRVTNIDGNGKSDGGKDYPIDTAIMMYGMNNSLDESREYGDKNSPDYQVQKYDLLGRVAELTFPNKGLRYVSRFDGSGREVEQLVYKNGKLSSAERYTYTTNSYGDWTKKHVTFWSADVPNLGFTPSENDYREITYYRENGQ